MTISLWYMHLTSHILMDKCHHLRLPFFPPVWLHLLCVSQLITEAYVWGMLDCRAALWQADGLFPLSKCRCCRTKSSWCVEVWLLERAVSTPSTMASYGQRGALHKHLCHVSDMESNTGQYDFLHLWSDVQKCFQSLWSRIKKKIEHIIDHWSDFSCWNVCIFMLLQCHIQCGNFEC